MKRYIDPTVLPPWLKRFAKAPRALTSRLRVLPDFIIIGAQRCGTTSLYRYLIQHPSIAPAFRKEVHFFSKNFRKGPNWYREHFPSYLYKNTIRALLGRAFLTGEASTDYIFHPYAAQRAFRTVPRVKLIVLLRNPVDRAYSHYYHEVRKERESLSFEAAIEREPERLNSEDTKGFVDRDYSSYNYLYYSYLTRGIYVDQLKAWMALFPREQVFILRSEDFYADPSTALLQTLEFLEVEKWELPEYRKYNYGGYSRLDAAENNRPLYPSMDGAVRKALIDYFKPYNQRLYQLLGTDFDWDR